MTHSTAKPWGLQTLGSGSRGAMPRLEDLEMLVEATGSLSSWPLGGGHQAGHRWLRIPGLALVDFRVCHDGGDGLDSHSVILGTLMTLIVA